MSQKNKHFVSIVTPLDDAVVVDIYLTKEEYELINLLSTLFMDIADATEPVLVISKAIPDLTAPDEDAVLPPLDN